MVPAMYRKTLLTRMTSSDDGFSRVLDRKPTLYAKSGRVPSIYGKWDMGNRYLVPKFAFPVHLASEWVCSLSYNPQN